MQTLVAVGDLLYRRVKRRGETCERFALFVARGADFEVQRTVRICAVFRLVIRALRFVRDAAEVVLILLCGNHALGIIYRGIAASAVRAVRAVFAAQIRVFVGKFKNGTEPVQAVRPVIERDGADDAKQGEQQRIKHQQKRRFFLAHCLLLIS